MNSNEELIQSLVKDGYLKSQPVIDAFKKIDRKDFVIEEEKDRAYENTALSIGNKQTISQPLVVAFMLELLELKAGDKILEIGSGSGWNTALLAYLVGKPQTDADGTQTDAESQHMSASGQRQSELVVSIERIPELYELAKKNLAKYGLMDLSPNESLRSSALSQRVSAVLVKLIQGDGSRGHEAGAPYDKIIAAASAEEIPVAWKDQLKIGGRIVAPVKNSILVMEKLDKDNFETKEYFGFSFVPLISP